MTNSDLYVKKETYRKKKQGKILEGNGAVFDHGLISMLGGAWSASSACAGSYENTLGRGDTEQSTADDLRGKICLQSKQRPHFSKEKQRDSLQSSCRDSRKAFPRATWYNLWPGGPLKFCSYHKIESFFLIIFLWVMLESCHVLLL